MVGQHTRHPLVWWLAAAVVTAASSSWAMWQVVSVGEKPIQGATGIDFAGMDFASTTWNALRGLLAGQDVYTTSTRIAGLPVTWPAGEHVPATLVWQAPFAALPLRAGFLAFDVCTIVAIWAAVLILTRSRSPQAILLAACCGAFAIITSGGMWTLMLGQPAGFELLGVAILVRARRPWVAALGFLLAASTFQTGVPLVLALIVLRAWPVVWRGTALTVMLSLPPAALGISAARGLVPYARVFTLGALGHLAKIPGEPRGLDDQPNRIDLGGLLHWAGIESTGVQLTAGLLVLVLSLLFLARLPAIRGRLDYPPVLCLVLAAAILCSYHQPYDMLLVSGAVIPIVLLAGDRSALMLGVFAAAGISVAVTDNVAAAAVLDPVCLVVVVVLSALVARRVEKAACDDSPGSTSSKLTPTSGAIDVVS